MVLLRKKNTKEKRGKPWSIIHKEERDLIQVWRCNRLKDQGHSYRKCLLYSFSLDTLKSFLLNFNFMVLIQMVIAVLAVFIFQYFRISVDINVSLFVSPIVFPLAFSINSDFQRREKVLEDLAVFKSSGMVWYFCMREWKQASGLDTEWINDVHSKLKSLLFHLCEYLLTTKTDCRKIILRAMYEDFSDANILIERLRESELPTNSAIVSRSVHLLHMMCLSFERLRVVREYRSPRSIRSFNKVFIMFLPIILGPYFVHIGLNDKNTWEPYYLAVLLAAVFSTLQSAQDKLDDPFDGMGEDDINLDTIDEWALDTFENNTNKNRKTTDSGHYSAESAYGNVRLAECFGVLATSAICSPNAVDGNVDFLKYPPYTKAESPSLNRMNEKNDETIIDLNDENDKTTYDSKSNNQSENRNSECRYPDADQSNKTFLCPNDNDDVEMSRTSSYLDLGTDNFPDRDHDQKRRFSELNYTSRKASGKEMNSCNNSRNPLRSPTRGCSSIKNLFCPNPWKKKTKSLQEMLADEVEKRQVRHHSQNEVASHSNNNNNNNSNNNNNYTSTIQMILDLNDNGERNSFCKANERTTLCRNSIPSNKSCYSDKNDNKSTSAKELLSLSPTASFTKRKNNTDNNNCNSNSYVKYQKKENKCLTK